MAAGGFRTGGGSGEEGGQSLVAVGEVLRAVALGLEIEEEALGEVGFVFDEDDEGGVGHEVRWRGAG